jgi:UDP-N-acetylglucosamine 1-carboxyvinyltransferase
MSKDFIVVEKSGKLTGTVRLAGAKNAVLVIMASLILSDGKSELYNVPNNADVQCMIALLNDLGAKVCFDVSQNHLVVNTSGIHSYEINPNIMNKMRASILVMGPLLARFGRAKVALPGGCMIGARPINYHLDGFTKMGVSIKTQEPFLDAKVQSHEEKNNLNRRIVLEYPSVGATENLLMFASFQLSETVIVNASFEPEVLDLISVLSKMGTKITCIQGSCISIVGTKNLRPVSHYVIPDRLEAGTLLLAAAVTGGEVKLPNARADHLDVFLEKLSEMGHNVTIATNPDQDFILQGIELQATNNPIAVHFKTGPYPGFPTDLQASFMAALCFVEGKSIVEETVFENRFMHVKELQKMGANITLSHNIAIIKGKRFLYGTKVTAFDIRASAALVIAGLAANGATKILGLSHWKRGYDSLEEKLRKLGAVIEVVKNCKKREELQIG